ncbi:MAG: histidine kinase dimerization/phosphoacceptor domain -containing protein [Erythrobacter sp.]|jgi:two-component sensor histidine kinase|nr:histidine kinase dimerization/phosphoacceptor domain -containing protein [Erythrobacter sp.]
MTSDPAPLRVLYADPDKVAALQFSQDMGAAGLDVTHVATIDDAAPLASLRRHDVMLLGPLEKSGALQDALSVLLAALDAPPLVCMTAPDRAGDALAVLEAGATPLVLGPPAPARIGVLVATLRRSAAEADALSAARMARAEAAEERTRAAVLLNEMKHRIANSLALVVSMAHLQANSMATGEGQRAVEDFADKIHALAQVHKGLYASMKVGTVALDTYLAKLGRELHRNHVGRGSLGDLTLECIPLSVSVDQAISLGVILSEFVSNAARFAYPGDRKGDVRVVVSRSDTGGATLLVEDDGAGLGDSPTARPGLGSQIVGVLAHGLGGWFELKPRETGMMAVLHFPLPVKD